MIFSLRNNQKHSRLSEFLLKRDFYFQFLKTNRYMKFYLQHQKQNYWCFSLTLGKKRKFKHKSTFAFYKCSYDYLQIVYLFLNQLPSAKCVVKTVFQQLQEILISNCLIARKSAFKVSYTLLAIQNATPRRTRSKRAKFIWGIIGYQKFENTRAIQKLTSG